MWHYILFMFISIIFLVYFVKKYRRWFDWIVFNVYFSFFYIAFLLLIFIWPYPILNGRTVKNGKLWASLLKHMTILYGVQWEIRDSEVLAKDRGAVIVANHQSIIDIVGLFHIWETVDKLTVIAKKEVLYAGPLGIIAYFGGLVFLDRRNPKNAYKQLEVTANVMKEKTKIWIFPEGTRNYDYTKLLPFKKGAFMMAVAAQTPIIPVVYSPYKFIDRKSYRISKACVIVQCLEEVPTIGLTMDDVPELIERVRNMMLAAYEELSKEVSTSTPNNGYKENNS